MFNKLKLIVEDTDALKKAKDPSTPAEKLASYTTHRNPDIQKAAMSNPNTPFENLAGNAEDHPKEFTENPILPLQMLEDPNWLQNISSSAVHPLIDHDSDFWLNKFLNSPSYMHRRKAASHKNIKPEDIKNIFELNNPHWNVGLTKNPNTPHEILDKLGDSKDQNILLSLAEREDLSPELYTKLLNTKYANNMPHFLVNNKGIPTNILHDLYDKYNDHSRAIRSGLANNKNSDSTLLDKLLQHPERDHDLVNSVLNNNNLSSETIHSLLDDINFTNSYSSHIIGHPNASAETLDTISKRYPSYDMLQQNIVSHPNVSHTTLNDIHKNPMASRITKAYVEINPKFKKIGKNTI